jgi:hypothetical protein
MHIHKRFGKEITRVVFLWLSSLEFSDYLWLCTLYVSECLLSTLNCKAYKSKQSVRKHFIFQTQTELVVDSPCIMFRVAYGADDLNGRIYR